MSDIQLSYRISFETIKVKTTEFDVLCCTAPKTICILAPLVLQMDAF
jgi:hypothetical protein